MSKKLCEICGVEPATIPDRNRMGRLINRVCQSCHVDRLAGDFKRLAEKVSAKNRRAEHSMKGESK